MILEALYRLAQDEGLVDDPDFEVRPVAWLVDVGLKGEWLGIRGTHSEETEISRGRERKRTTLKSIRTPRQPGRTRGDRAFFFVDKPDYALALYVANPTLSGDADKPERRVKRAALFRRLIDDCAQNTGDAGAAAVAALLDRIGSGHATVSLPVGAGPGDLCAFVYAPDVDVCVHERPAVVAYWREQRRANEKNEGSARCIVTGTKTLEAAEFPSTKRVPGANPKGGTLVSFNAAAFESYRLDGNDNAPVSRPAAEACAAALSRLFDSGYRKPTAPEAVLPVRHVRLGGDVLVGYWGAGAGSAAFVDVLADLIAGEDPARVGESYRSIWYGKPVALDDPSAFFGLTVSGAQGRLVIRDWFETTVTQVNTSLAKHFVDLAIVRNVPAPTGRELPPTVPLRALLGSLAPFGKAEEVPAPLVTALVSAALRGGRYPLSVLQRAVERARAEIGKDEWADLERRDARAALIKAVLIRHFNRKLAPDMDPTNTQAGYLLGRLMAVIERLQQVAQGDVNASVIDRYFGSASATPRAVFTRLLRNARHHARKAKDNPEREGAARWLDQQIDTIAAHFDPERNGFPAHLDLEQQGLFVLGYHQQRHYLWMTKAEREAWAARWQLTPTQAA